MSFALVTGTISISVSLFCYSIATITEQKSRNITFPVIVCMLLGNLLDIAATYLMLLSSGRSPFSLHALIGYSTVLIMFVLSGVMISVRMKNGNQATAGNLLHYFIRFAYFWRIFSYIAGGILVGVNNTF